jgi:hypothetical protein
VPLAKGTVRDANSSSLRSAASRFGGRDSAHGDSGLGLPVNLSCRQYDKEGSEVSAWALNQRDPRVLRYTADRTFPVEFVNLGSCWVAPLHEYYRLTDPFREDCETLGAL